MNSSYHMDLEQFSLNRARQVVESSYLLPSKQLLREQVPERFAVLEEMKAFLEIARMIPLVVEY